ncbi:hypothetical protein [Sphingobium boeckii]|uniref:Uncharacterized protein n=1 Tax=Sphingobium boeckii TaxID=1082345 RepID=A0A7W9AI99_9SPHN|nr:hypothetical protein [Sphingobium boeckii]MBB5686068.1 hypothetical protein [Sphingobium boeckii]
MRMLSIAIIAALGVSAPAFAEKAAEKSFEHEGTTYVYHTEAKSGGKVISGRSYPGGESFRLIVANGMVRGTSSGSAVAFKLSQVKSVVRDGQVAAAD